MLDCYTSWCQKSTKKYGAYKLHDVKTFAEQPQSNLWASTDQNGDGNILCIINELFADIENSSGDSKNTKLSSLLWLRFEFPANNDFKI